MSILTAERAIIRVASKPKWSLSARLVLAVLAAQASATLAIGFAAQPLSAWAHLGTAITATSRIAAMSGTFLSLLLLVLASRLPWLEQQFGQDRLVWWHRKLAPYSLYLILGHLVLVVVGYGLTTNVSVWQEFWQLVFGTEWMLAALVAFVFMMAVGLTSWRRARSRMSYETWWLLHLYSYLGVALAFLHQVNSGQMFVDHPGLKLFWAALYLETFAVIIAFRVYLPIATSLRHDLRVERVIRETPSTISVVIRGRELAALGARGGQFFGWHFLVPGEWWQSHPYSLSATPRNNRMRITVKNLGDHSQWLASVAPGTRVAVEGPYGTFVADRALSNRIVLIAGGVGVTPVRALLEELPRDAVVDLLWRASYESELPLRGEIEALAADRDARIHYLVGSRRFFPMDARQLSELVPDLSAADVFLCGPAGLVEGAIAALDELGVPKHRIHDETFDF